MEAINSSMANPSGHTKPEVEGTIWNATQHIATADQKAQGVVDLPEELRKDLLATLTFEEMPEEDELYLRSMAVAGMLMAVGAKPGDKVMVGGAPFFMEELCHTLRRAGYAPVFAFSKRESAEKVMPDGSTVKTAIFRHLGFVEPTAPQP